MRASRVTLWCIVTGLLWGCDLAPQSSIAPCVALYGSPTASTGLNSEQCRPSCPCAGWSYESPSPATIDAWRSAPLPVQPSLTQDPYLGPVPALSSGVCGVRWSADGRYTLVNAADEAELASLDARITHRGACGLCSTLKDLAVYSSQPDLTDPVRNCGLAHITDLAGNQKCLEKIGFSAGCAAIWAYNTQHTRKKCLDLCIQALSAPHHDANGQLNACLQCDEDQSGPIFKAIAGRTRRNSGLPSALCRPCDSVAQIRHDELLGSPRP